MYTSQADFGDLVFSPTTYIGMSSSLFGYVYVRHWKFEDNLSTNGTVIVGGSVWLLSCPLLPTCWTKPFSVGCSEQYMHFRVVALRTQTQKLHGSHPWLGVQTFLWVVLVATRLYIQDSPPTYPLTILWYIYIQILIQEAQTILGVNVLKVLICANPFYWRL